MDFFDDATSQRVELSGADQPQLTLKFGVYSGAASAATDDAEEGSELLLLTVRADQCIEARETSEGPDEGAFIRARFSTLGWRRYDQTFDMLGKVVESLLPAGLPLSMQIGGIKCTDRLYPAARYYVIGSLDPQVHSALLERLPKVLSLLQDDRLWLRAESPGHDALSDEQTLLEAAQMARDQLRGDPPCKFSVLADGHQWHLGERIAPPRQVEQTTEIQLIEGRPDGGRWSRHEFFILTQAGAQVDISYDGAAHEQLVKEVSTVGRPLLSVRVTIKYCGKKIIGRRLESLEVIGPELPF